MRAGPSSLAIALLAGSLLAPGQAVGEEASGGASGPAAPAAGILGAAVGFPARVDVIEFNGLWLTRKEVLLRELPFQVGEEVDEARWTVGRERLWNTALLSRLSARLERRGSRVAAVYDLEEKFTTSGIFSFAVGGGTGWLQLGLYDINLLGRFVEAGALYERYGERNGGEAWGRDPRLFGRRLDGRVLVKSLFRTRPGFDQRRSAVHLEISGEPSDQLRVGGDVELLRDDFFNVPEADSAPANSWGVQSGLSVRLGRVNNERVRYHGASLTLAPILNASSDPVYPRYARLGATALGYLMPGERWNLALRIVAGASTEAPAQDLYYVGGLDLVRGYAANAYRTDRFAAANAEVRLAAFDSTWFALMPVAFVDAAAVHVAPGVRWPVSLGLGVRLLVPRMNQVGVRFDVALPLVGARRPGWGLGVCQFF